MVASAQDENPRHLLTHAEQYPTVPEPSPEPQAHAVASRFGIHWNATTQRCECSGCEAVRAPRTAPSEPRTVQLRARDPWTTFADVLCDRKPFKTYGTFRGVRGPVDSDSGYLRSRSVAAANLWAADLDKIDYVVYSYATPIAWHVTGDRLDEWIYPDVKYSRTTSAHQTKIKTSLEINSQMFGHLVRWLRDF
jgi:hypothetical protein